MPCSAWKCSRKAGEMIRCLAISVVCLLFITATNGSANGETHMQREPAVAKGSVEQGRRAERLSKRPGCFYARVQLGKKPGIIGITVRCRARARTEGESFIVKRYSPAEPRKGRRLLGFSGDLHVTSLGGGRGQGNCRLQRFSLACRARGGAQFIAKGWLHVPKRRRCTLPVSVFAFYPSQCEGECIGPLEGKGLFDRRPEGC